jgi:multisubunit Na+/H+ antiporter MnhG subunit
MIYLIDAKIFLEALLFSLVTLILVVFVIHPLIKHLIQTIKMFDDFKEEMKPLISEIKQQEKKIIELKEKLKSK